MLGYKLFLEQIKRLSLSEQKKFISNVFEKEIKVFSIDCIDEKLCIKFYDGYIYYQFLFIFDNVGRWCFDIKIKERIIICNIFVDNINIQKGAKSNFYQFLELLKNDDVNCLNLFLRDDF